MNYIFNFNPYINNNIDNRYLSNIEYKIENKISLTNEEVNYLLSTIIYLTRYKINKNLDNFDFKCDLAQSILYYYFKNLNCNIHPLTTQHSINQYVKGHSFLTLELIINNKTKYYLLDPTYIQFFKTEKCTENNYYIHPLDPNHIILTPDPGFYIQNNMKEKATFLLNYGFVELTEETAQMYGNSFYNTKTGINFNIKQYQNIPGFVYLNAFTKGTTPLSKSEEELINEETNITPFKNQSNKKNNR